MQLRPLEYPITELEIETAVKKIRIQAKYETKRLKLIIIKPIIINFLTMFLLGVPTMPLMWCSGLITPIFKSGERNDLTNYRGICVLNCLGKLFCSILNQRLMELVNSLNILYNSQIGFLPHNRTADTFSHYER